MSVWCEAHVSEMPPVFPILWNHAVELVSMSLLLRGGFCPSVA